MLLCPCASVAHVALSVGAALASRLAAIPDSLASELGTYVSPAGTTSVSESSKASAVLDGRCETVMRKVTTWPKPGVGSSATLTTVSSGSVTGSEREPPATGVSPVCGLT